MKRANISELRDRLSQYLDHVRSGGRVLIFDRDKPIAEIVPIGSRAGGFTATDAERLVVLERDGLVRPGTGRLPRELRDEPPPGQGAGVLAALLQERESGR
jgi:antitoxin (DNA-binding transcriptional repressor) of toxin-antitoxin stability system